MLSARAGSVRVEGFSEADDTPPAGGPLHGSAGRCPLRRTPPECSAANFELTPAGLSAEAPLVVPANSTAELPADGLEAPAIRMLELPVEQDACRGAEIPLVLSGEAQG